MRTFSLSLFSIALLLVVGCGDDTDPDAGFDDDDAEEVTTLQIVKGKHGPDFPDARFAIVTPAAGEVVSGDSVMVTTKLTGVVLKAPTPGEGANDLAYSKDGQHIHVFVDDRPYMAKYDTTFSIGALEPGVHTLRAFPSRSWHESIKRPDAFVAHTFYVGEKAGEPHLQPDRPLLTYSRPKGEYVGEDAEKIMLDFYLVNCELGPDAYKVVASIDGQTLDTLTDWVPYYIEGLDEGEHTIGLTLIGPDGKPVSNGPFNDVQQTITVKAEKEVAASSGTEDEGDMEKDMFDAGRHSSGM